MSAVSEDLSGYNPCILYLKPPNIFASFIHLELYVYIKIHRTVAYFHFIHWWHFNIGEMVPAGECVCIEHIFGQQDEFLMTSGPVRIRLFTFDWPGCQPLWSTLSFPILLADGNSNLPSKGEHFTCRRVAKLRLRMLNSINIQILKSWS